MDEINHSFNWGGYRPGAGQKPKWNSGATATIRVPEKLIPDVMQYARLIDGQFPNGLQASNCLSCSIDSVTQSRDLADQLEAVKILQLALTLKANAGGAIKAEIKRALQLLQVQEQES